MHKIDRLDFQLSILSHVSALIWWVVLWWALHHLAFQIASLFHKPNKTGKSDFIKPQIALLYLTCDDFNSECCKSCIEQDYEKIKVFICDDSKEETYKQQVYKFYKHHSSHCKLISREIKQGFKAGNINHVIKNFVEEENILIIDADQYLPSDYVSQIVEKIPEDYSRIAFIQSAHEPKLDNNSTYFQQILSAEISLYYYRDLAIREKFGFVPNLGHGTLIHRSTWEKIGKYPEIVSEDFAFALRTANIGQVGIYLEDVVSFESYPIDFGGFLVRLKKFAGGSAELFRKEVIKFLTGSAQIVEKVDFTFMLLWYILMPLVTINGFLGAYVCYRLWDEGIPYIHPILPYLYTWLLLSIFVIIISIVRERASVMQFYFWSTAIYTASMPIAALAFIKGLFFDPHFHRTPKNKEKSKVSILNSLGMVLLGISAVYLSLSWLSPFSPILAGQGAAYLSFPLYPYLCKENIIGKIGRFFIYIPGVLFLFALYAMWNWGR